MSFFEHSVVFYVSAWASTIGLFWVLFSCAETIASQDVKNRVRRWLRMERSPDGVVQTWPQTFANVFDSVFGEKHLSWRCFWRSSIASLVVVIILYILWAALWPSNFEIFQSKYDFDFWSRRLVIVLLPVVIGGLLNVIPGYLSLLETRYVIKRMSMMNSVWKRVGFLCLDFVLTGSIFIGGLLVVLFLIWSADLIVSVNFLGVLIDAFTLRSLREGVMSTGIFFYSTYFTSVWAWMYVLSGLFAKVVVISGSRFEFLKRLINIDKEPILALGTISIVIITLAYLIAAPWMISDVSPAVAGN